MQQRIEAILSRRELIQRIFFAYVLVYLVYRFLIHTSFHQLQGAELLYLALDETYWTLYLAGIPQAILSTPTLAYLLDGLLLLTAGLAFFQPNSTWGARLFTPLLFLYSLTFNMAAGHHYHSVGLLLLSLTFCFQGNAFGRWWLGARYYFLFILVSASLWKIFRGTLWHTEHFSAILISQNIEFLVNYGPEFYLTQFKTFLIDHSMLSHILWMAMAGLQFSFIIGFFTMKYDRFLIIGYLLFITGGFVLMNIVSPENLPALLLLFPWALKK